MGPGKVHAVMSLTDCVTEGGHFYLEDLLTNTLATRLNEHRFGHTNTNTEHVTAELFLQGGVRMLYAQLQNIGVTGELSL
jgi:hypothetical protein